MAQQIEVLAAKPGNPEPIWCKERADSCKLFSDPHVHVGTHVHTHNNNNKINAALCLAASEGLED